jgi:hypothetical protein
VASIGHHYFQDSGQPRNINTSKEDSVNNVLNKEYKKGNGRVWLHVCAPQLNLNPFIGLHLKKDIFPKGRLLLIRPEPHSHHPLSRR